MVMIHVARSDPPVAKDQALVDYRTHLDMSSFLRRAQSSGTTR